MRSYLGGGAQERHVRAATAGRVQSDRQPGGRYRDRYRGMAGQVVRPGKACLGIVITYPGRRVVLWRAVSHGRANQHLRAAQARVDLRSQDLAIRLRLGVLHGRYRAPAVKQRSGARRVLASVPAAVNPVDVAVTVRLPM